MTRVEYLKGQTALNRNAKEHYGIAQGRGTCTSMIIQATLDCEHALISAAASFDICLDDFDPRERSYLIENYLYATPFQEVYNNRFPKAPATMMDKDMESLFD